MAANPKPKKARATRAASPQFQICTLLLQGDRSRDELLADVSAERNAFNQALFAAKSKGRVAFIEKADKYRLTKEGRDWVTGGANLAQQKAVAKAAAAPRGRARRAVGKRARRSSPAAAHVPHSPRGGQPVELASVDLKGPERPKTFRCAIDSDGGFLLEKGGVRIELTTDESRWMFAYLDRMAAEDAA